MLSALASVGVAMFMFLIGAELDHRSVRSHGRVVGWVSTGSLVVPFGLGVALAVWLAPGDLRFALFLGTAMAVTAFPVLARIIADRGLVGTRVGDIALTSAAVGDVVAWTLLAVIVAAGGAPWRLLFAVPYLLLMTTVVRRVLRDPRVLRPGALSAPVIVVFGILLSGGLTELMGLHVIFGAFLFGLVMPRTGTQRSHADATTRVGNLATLFLPVYFLVAGLSVDPVHTGRGRVGPARPDTAGGDGRQVRWGVHGRQADRDGGTASGCVGDADEHPWPREETVHDRRKQDGAVAAG